MPNVRNTPKRRRADCPTCGRNISYTYPWLPSSDGGMVRDYTTKVFAAHKAHALGRWTDCDVNGPHGFGYRQAVL